MNEQPQTFPRDEVEAAFRHHGLDVRYINCEVPPELLGDAVRGARAMGWVGFNCSLPHKVTVIEHLDGTERVARIAHWDGESLALLPDAFALGSCTADPSPVRVEAYADADPKVAIGRFLLLRGGH